MGMYDILMLVIFVGAVLFGAWKGLAWQIASLSAIVVSYIVAMNFREPLAAYIQAEPPWNKFGAMAILFLGTSLIIWLIFGRVKNSIKKMHLSGFDRQAGALLGAVKGALLCMVVTMFAVTLFGQSTTQAVFNSRSGGYISRGINQLTAVVPPEIHDVINPYVERFNQVIGVTDETSGGQFVEQPPDNQSQFNPYRQTSSNQGYQNYQGQWQLPQPQYGNQSQYPNQSQYSNQNPQPPIYQGQNSGQFQVPQGQGITLGQDENGIPSLNFQINPQDWINAGSEAAREAARRLLESNQPGSNRQ